MYLQLITRLDIVNIKRMISIYICNTNRSRLFKENIATVGDIQIRIISLIKTQKKGKK